MPAAAQCNIGAMLALCTPDALAVVGTCLLCCEHNAQTPVHIALACGLLVKRASVQTFAVLRFAACPALNKVAVPSGAGKAMPCLATPTHAFMSTLGTRLADMP